MFKKEYLKGFLTGAIVATLVTGVAFAQDITKTAKVTYKNIKVYVNGSEIKPTDAKGNPAEPFVMDGSIYLPLRAAGKAVGESVKWDGATNTAYLDEMPEKIVKEAEPGDVIGIEHEYMGYKYEHYGVYSGDNKVIHYTTLNGSTSAADAVVTETAMDGNFEKGKYFVIKFNKQKVFSNQETLERAKSMLGEQKYNLISNNCEHFSMWCKMGNRKSFQIDSLTPDQLAQLKKLSSLLGVGL